MKTAHDYRYEIRRTENVPGEIAWCALLSRDDQGVGGRGLFATRAEAEDAGEGWLAAKNQA